MSRKRDAKNGWRHMYDRKRGHMRRNTRHSFKVVKTRRFEIGRGYCRARVMGLIWTFACGTHFPAFSDLAKAQGWTKTYLEGSCAPPRSDRR
ncbi:hypothetical protein EV363DRAFT_1160771 [Boletus edulis]|uniref:Uncharacterized protein n=1 Tax=Boletus edulis BED1 TaxID=1328754 RepID=A0AAD4C132_BOLED|nr:hypothetical protein EV363DRAFT_1160771 [Boletus edulis]KAF8444836.1 hypothetical protein L210DRAFT_318442 [Boletus edulis BED1]